jgi:hypothetical protein
MDASRPHRRVALAPGAIQRCPGVNYAVIEQALGRYGATEALRAWGGLNSKLRLAKMEYWMRSNEFAS